MGRNKNGVEHRRKGPAGTGRSRKREKLMRRNAAIDLHDSLVTLQEKKKKQAENAKKQAGNSEKGGQSTGFEKALAGVGKDIESIPFARCFWQGGSPAEGEPDLAMKLKRKELGVKVRGSSIPEPASTFAHPGLPAAFGEFHRHRQSSKKGKIEKPTPIQAQVWPAALFGADVIGIAPTGSGKTLAYILPAVSHILGQKLEKDKVSSPSCLVLAPTRELAKQVCDTCGGGSSSSWLKHLFGLRAGAVYGGIGKEVQLDSLVTLGVPQILCATPGRLLDLIGLSILCCDKVTYMVLDEADRMLALGFEAQLNAIFKTIRPNRQVLLFSATFALKLQTAAEEWMSQNRVVIRVATMQLDHDGGGGDDDDEATAEINPDGESVSKKREDEDVPQSEKKETEKDAVTSLSTLTVSPTIEQTVHLCAQHKKQKKLMKFLAKVATNDRKSSIRQRSAVLIFCAQIKTLRELARFLEKQGTRCAPLHSGIPQARREQALVDFKCGKIDILVATDVASRGLHISRLRYVVNYDFPSNLASYCHRIGRVGRQGAQGFAFSFFTRSLAPMAASLVALLNRTSQWVDPNLKALADGREVKEDDGDDAGDDQPDHDQNGDKQPSGCSSFQGDSGAPSSVAAEAPISKKMLRRQRQEAKKAAKNVSTARDASMGDMERQEQSDSDINGSAMIGVGGGVRIRPSSTRDRKSSGRSEEEEADEQEDSDSGASGAVAIGLGGGVRIRPSRKRRSTPDSSDEDDEHDSANDASAVAPLDTPVGRHARLPKKQRKKARVG